MKKIILLVSLIAGALIIYLGAVSNDHRQLTLNLNGFGPVKTGMSLAAASQALGITLIEDDKPANPNDCHYGTNQKALPGMYFMLVNQKIVRISINEPTFGTDKGAKIGMTEADIKKLYSNAKMTGHPYNETGHYFSIGEKTGKFCLIFETDGTAVTSFRAGECEAVRWIEGCS